MIADIETNLMRVFTLPNGRCTVRIECIRPCTPIEAGEEQAFTDDPIQIPNPDYVPAVGQPEIMDIATMELVPNPDYVPAVGEPTIPSTTRRYFRLPADHPLPACDPQYYKWQDSEPWIVEASQQEKDQIDLEDAQAEDARQAAKTPAQKDAENRLIRFCRTIPGYADVTQVDYREIWAAILATGKAMVDAGQVSEYAVFESIIKGILEIMEKEFDSKDRAALVNDARWHPEIVQ